MIDRCRVKNKQTTKQTDQEQAIKRGLLGERTYIPLTCPPFLGYNLRLDHLFN